MKTIKSILTIVCMGLMAQYSFGQMSGTQHDFSGENWNNTGEICVVCHTPHNADITVQDAPLWNHQVTSSVFTLYDVSPTFDGAATIGQPDGSSKLCLSCHDGTIAIENFGNQTNGSDFMSGNKNLTTNLRDDHPISFTFDAALATTDGELFNPTTALSGLGGTINADMLYAGKVQCASCHDPHGTGNDDFLRVNNSGSALCLTCHDK